MKSIASESDARLNNAQVFTIRRRLETLGATTSAKSQQHLESFAKRHGTSIFP